MRIIPYLISVVAVMASFVLGYMCSHYETKATAPDNWEEQKYELIKAAITPKPSLRDYQIELHMDTVWIYSGDRLVDSFLTDYKSKYDSIFLKDNE
jgi:hypothetical protein